MTTLREALARNMKARRGILGLTQADLAERAGISPGYIGEIEIARKFPAPETLELLALALNTRAYRLLMTEADVTEVAETSGREAYWAVARRFQERLDQDIVELLGSGRGDD